MFVLQISLYQLGKVVLLSFSWFFVAFASPHILIFLLHAVHRSLDKLVSLFLVLKGVENDNQHVLESLMTYFKCEILHLHFIPIFYTNRCTLYSLLLYCKMELHN